VTFSDPENMKKFMESKIKEMQSTESEKIETLKRKINQDNFNPLFYNLI
jgi:hypothetical protein